MIHFRKFNENDWNNFEEIVEEAFARENIQKENFLQMLDDDGLIGAFRNEKLVGYLRLLLIDKYGHLGQIAVEKSERGKGYGNKLMDYAIDYFSKKEMESVGLYVETKNKVAISLYEKYGFEKKFESWHYWINEEQIKQIEKKYQLLENENLRVLISEDFEIVLKTFPKINANELKLHLTKLKTRGLSGGESIPLGLFVDNELKVYGRFNPEFPGCRPFLITETEYLDKFIVGLKGYKKRDYLRITFDRNKEVAEFCEKRGYRLHHHLWFMEKKM